MEKIEIMIADDHQIFIDGLESILSNVPEIKIIGTALNGTELLDAMYYDTPHLVLMDINMPEMDGIAATKRIKIKYPETKVLMLTMYNTKDFITNVLESGADGYILKNTGKQELMIAINTVMNGGNYYSQEVTETIMRNISAPKPLEINPDQLTKREKEIISMIAQELNTAEIAKTMHLSTNTVETHRKNIMQKLRVKNIAGIAIYAMKYGLIGE
jgi:DNA-binding NarL/FixJ family response regulator